MCLLIFILFKLFIRLLVFGEELGYNKSKNVMKIYFARHGETGFNVNELFQDKDVPLNKNGKKQAEFLAKRFSKIPIDIIISSPAARAKETAEIISRKLEKKVIFSELADERKMPKETVGKYSFSKELIKIKKAMKKNAENPLWHYSDEENYTEFKNRIKKFFKYLENSKEKNILVVSHGGPIRMAILFMMFCGKDVAPEIYYSFIDIFRMINTGITLCEKENDHWHLWTFNDHAHLG